MRKKRARVTNWKSYSGYIFVMPFIIGLAIIFLPALIQSFTFVFQEVNIEFEGLDRTFIGLENIREAFFVDPAFRFMLTFGIFYTLTDSIQIMIFSFFVASILNQHFIGRSLARMIFFLPVILATGIVADIRVATAGFQGGLTVGMEGGGEFQQFGAAALFNIRNFLMDIVDNVQIQNMLATAIHNTQHVVNASGVQILIFLMALRSINPSIFEASKVEGASKWEEFWKITFPLITPMLFVNFVYTIIATFASPNYGILSYIRHMAFGMLRIGFASAMAWIYAVAILIVLGVFTFIFSKRMTYLDN